MNFTPEEKAIIEAARPIWDGYLKSLTMNTGQREIADLKALYAEKFEISGKYPEWSGGCIDCIVNCMRRVFDAYDAENKQTKKAKLEKASIADDEQVEKKAKKGGKKSAK